MNWYKYTVILNPTDYIGYVDLEEKGYNDIDDYLEDLRRDKYPHVEYFRVDYDKIDMPPKDYVEMLIRGLEAPELWKRLKAAELREAIGLPPRDVDWENMEQMGG